MKRILLFLCACVVPILACGRQVVPVSVTPSPVASIGTETNTPNAPKLSVTKTPAETQPVPILASYTAAGAVYIRDASGAATGYLQRGDTVQCQPQGDWCVLDGGNRVWAGCLSPNPDGLGCKERR